MDDHGYRVMGRLAGALWLVMFAALLVFLVGVVVWAIAGPLLAIVIFAVAVLFFVVLPYRARTRKTAPRR